MSGRTGLRLGAIALFLMCPSGAAAGGPPDSDALRSLPYVTGTRAPGPRSGVTVHDAERAAPGLNLYVSGHGPEAILMDMDGRVLHRWRKAPEEIWSRDDLRARGDPPAAFRRAHLLENGDLLAIVEGVGIVRLGPRSRVIWASANGAHHDFHVRPDGTILLLAREERMRDDTGELIRSVIEDFVVTLDDSGREIGRTSLLDACVRSSFPELAEAARTQGGNILHANTLFLLEGRAAGRSPAFRKGNVLTSFRNLDLLAVLDAAAGTIAWTLTGSFRRQHDPRILPSGSLLLFDNGVDRSRVVEIDPVSGEELWEYAGTGEQPFFSSICGSAQRLENGNTLIVESDAGRAFEIAPDGATVWELLNPERAGEDGELVAVIYDLVRLPPSAADGWRERGGGG